MPTSPYWYIKALGTKPGVTDYLSKLHNENPTQQLAKQLIEQLITDAPPNVHFQFEVTGHFDSGEHGRPCDKHGDINLSFSWRDKLEKFKT